MALVVDFKTYIPEKRVWVSTVAHDMKIGWNRASETLVFPGDETGIKEWNEIYAKSHSYIMDRSTLQKIHSRIVEEIRCGERDLR